jgi:hypothetical protein
VVAGSGAGAILVTRTIKNKYFNGTYMLKYTCKYREKKTQTSLSSKPIKVA